MTGGTRRTDVVVVGAGVIGCSIAWHLAMLGVGRVTVLDAKGIGAGASGIQPGGMRTQYSSAVTRALALESRRFYLQFGDRLGVDMDLEFDASGYLFVAHTEASMAALRADAAEQGADGVRIEVLDAETAAELVPGLEPEGVAGAVYGPDDGYLGKPGAPVAGFAQAAERAGVRFETARVTGLRRRSAGGVEVLTASGELLSAGHVVIAAGPETGGIVATMGADVPVTGAPKYLFYSNPIRPQLVRPLVVFQDRRFAVKHLADGSVLASDLAFGKDDPADVEEAKRTIRTTATELLPILEHVRYPVAVRGVYDVTPDTQSVIGPVDEVGDVIVAAGMNGRGMMLAPAVGRLVAESVTKGVAADVPEELRVARFAGTVPVTTGETRVI